MQTLTLTIAGIISLINCLIYNTDMSIFWLQLTLKREIAFGAVSVF